MERKQLLENDYLTRTEDTPPYSGDQNRNGFENGVGAQSCSKQLGSVSIISGRKSFDLSSAFDRSSVALGWEDINVFVHRKTGCFDRCLRKARQNIEFVINQILHGGNYYAMTWL